MIDQSSKTPFKHSGPRIATHQAMILTPAGAILSIMESADIGPNDLYSLRYALATFEPEHCKDIDSFKARLRQERQRFRDSHILLPDYKDQPQDAEKYFEQLEQRADELFRQAQKQVTWFSEQPKWNQKINPAAIQQLQNAYANWSDDERTIIDHSGTLLLLQNIRPIPDHLATTLKSRIILIDAAKDLLPEGYLNVLKSQIITFDMEKSVHAPPAEMSSAAFQEIRQNWNILPPKWMDGMPSSTNNQIGYVAVNARMDPDRYAAILPQAYHAWQAMQKGITARAAEIKGISLTPRAKGDDAVVSSSAVIAQHHPIIITDTPTLTPEQQAKQENESKEDPLGCSLNPALAAKARGVRFDMFSDPLDISIGNKKKIKKEEEFFAKSFKLLPAEVRNLLYLKGIAFISSKDFAGGSDVHKNGAITIGTKSHYSGSSVPMAADIFAYGLPSLLNVSVPGYMLKAALEELTPIVKRGTGREPKSDAKSVTRLALQFAFAGQLEPDEGDKDPMPTPNAEKIFALYMEAAKKEMEKAEAQTQSEDPKLSMADLRAQAHPHVPVLGNATLAQREFFTETYKALEPELKESIQRAGVRFAILDEADGYAVAVRGPSTVGLDTSLFKEGHSSDALACHITGGALAISHGKKVDPKGELFRAADAEFTQYMVNKALPKIKDLVRRDLVKWKFEDKLAILFTFGNLTTSSSQETRFPACAKLFEATCNDTVKIDKHIDLIADLKDNSAEGVKTRAQHQQMFETALPLVPTYLLELLEADGTKFRFIKKGDKGYRELNPKRKGNPYNQYCDKDGVILLEAGNPGSISAQIAAACLVKLFPDWHDKLEGRTLLYKALSEKTSDLDLIDNGRLKTIIASPETLLEPSYIAHQLQGVMVRAQKEKLPPAMHTLLNKYLEAAQAEHARRKVKKPNFPDFSPPQGTLVSEEPRILVSPERFGAPTEDDVRQIKEMIAGWPEKYRELIQAKGVTFVPVNKPIEDLTLIETCNPKFYFVTMDDLQERNTINPTGLMIRALVAAIGPNHAGIDWQKARIDMMRLSLMDPSMRIPPEQTHAMLSSGSAYSHTMLPFSNSVLSPDAREIVNNTYPDGYKAYRNFMAFSDEECAKLQRQKHAPEILAAHPVHAYHFDINRELLTAPQQQYMDAINRTITTLAVTTGEFEQEFRLRLAEQASGLLAQLGKKLKESADLHYNPKNLPIPAPKHIKDQATQAQIVLDELWANASVASIHMEGKFKADLVSSTYVRDFANAQEMEKVDAHSVAKGASDVIAQETKKHGGALGETAFERLEQIGMPVRHYLHESMKEVVPGAPRMPDSEKQKFIRMWKAPDVPPAVESMLQRLTAGVVPLHELAESTGSVETCGFTMSAPPVAEMIHAALENAVKKLAKKKGMSDERRDLALAELKAAHNILPEAMKTPAQLRDEKEHAERQRLEQVRKDGEKAERDRLQAIEDKRRSDTEKTRLEAEAENKRKEDEERSKRPQPYNFSGSLQAIGEDKGRKGTYNLYAAEIAPICQALDTRDAALAASAAVLLPSSLNRVLSLYEEGSDSLTKQTLIEYRDEIDKARAEALRIVAMTAENTPPDQWSKYMPLRQALLEAPTYMGALTGTIKWMDKAGTWTAEDKATQAVFVEMEVIDALKPVKRVPFVYKTPPKPPPVPPVVEPVSVSPVVPVVTAVVASGIAAAMPDPVKEPPPEPPPITPVSQNTISANEMRPAPLKSSTGQKESAPLKAGHMPAPTLPPIVQEELAPVPVLENKAGIGPKELESLRQKSYLALAEILRDKANSVADNMLREGYDRFRCDLLQKNTHARIRMLFCSDTPGKPALERIFDLNDRNFRGGYGAHGVVPTTLDAINLRIIVNSAVVSTVDEGGNGFAQIFSKTSTGNDRISKNDSLPLEALLPTRTTRVKVNDYGYYDLVINCRPKKSITDIVMTVPLGVKENRTDNTEAAALANVRAARVLKHLDDENEEYLKALAKGGKVDRRTIRPYLPTIGDLRDYIQETVAQIHEIDPVSPEGKWGAQESNPLFITDGTRLKHQYLTLSDPMHYPGLPKDLRQEARNTIPRVVFSDENWMDALTVTGEKRNRGLRLPIPTLDHDATGFDIPGTQITTLGGAALSQKGSDRTYHLGFTLHVNDGTIPAARKGIAGYNIRGRSLNLCIVDQEMALNRAKEALFGNKEKYGFVDLLIKYFEQRPAAHWVLEEQKKEFKSPGGEDQKNKKLHDDLEAEVLRIPGEVITKGDINEYYKFMDKELTVDSLSNVNRRLNVVSEPRDSAGNVKIRVEIQQRDPVKRDQYVPSVSKQGQPVKTLAFTIPEKHAPLVESFLRGDMDYKRLDVLINDLMPRFEHDLSVMAEKGAAVQTPKGAKIPVEFSVMRGRLHGMPERHVNSKGEPVHVKIMVPAAVEDKIDSLAKAVNEQLGLRAAVHYSPIDPLQPFDGGLSWEDHKRLYDEACLPENDGFKKKRHPDFDADTPKGWLENAVWSNLRYCFGNITDQIDWVHNGNGNGNKNSPTAGGGGTQTSNIRERFPSKMLHLLKGPDAPEQDDGLDRKHNKGISFIRLT